MMTTFILEINYINGGVMIRTTTQTVTQFGSCGAACASLSCTDYLYSWNQLY